MRRPNIPVPAVVVDQLLYLQQHPDYFVEHIIGGKPTKWQKEALINLGLHDRIGIRSGHGVGKSAYMAWAALWWISTHYPCKIACTAPSAHQLEDVLWSELRLWHRRMNPVFRDNIEISGDRIQLLGSPESFGVARTSRKEQPEALQGFHSEHMLFLIDEASGVPDNVYEVAEGALSTPGAKVIMAANPTRTSGYFFDAFHKDRELWLLMHVPYNETNAHSFNPNYAKSIETRYGRESNVYRVRVEGNFPKADDDALIPFELMELALSRDVEAKDVEVIWGVDVARFGSNRSVIAKRRGNTQLEKAKWRQGLDTQQVARWVIDEYEDTPESERPARIYVDAIGVGAGVVDRLREEELPALGINVAESPSSREEYFKLRDELYWKVREWFEARDCRICDEDLMKELLVIHYAIPDSSRKIKVEGKDDIKKRTSRDGHGADGWSPDIADAWMLTFATGRDRPKGRRRHKRSRNWKTS